ncbi:uncharacterized protein LOC126998950 isoform X2 [Eriocheir sinensis]|nr:uncharacterized protein LOC126998950 isoform X2 [Eriocheir sinensis]
MGREAAGLPSGRLDCGACGRPEGASWCCLERQPPLPPVRCSRRRSSTVLGWYRRSSSQTSRASDTHSTETLIDLLLAPVPSHFSTR